MGKNRKNLMYILFFSLILLLAACTNETTPEKDKSIPNYDFEGNIFTNNQNQSIGLFGNDLRIAGIYDKEAKRKSSLDDIIESISEGKEEHKVEKIFTNAKLKIEDDQYIITADEGISLTFTKVGDRIIEDESGIKYYLNK